MLLIWYASFLVSIFTLIFGIFKRSWLFMLISTITFIPIAYYFWGAENAWKYVGFTPIILLILTIYFWFSGRKTEAL
ncbi:hypothetical protein ACIQ4I_01665 [Rummeliibacillus sp. NPDC094406]|uniref:hypothetical protein n=1 Tax=Rummeliibacillus sp. NPDC094406 TaxID=3364511 RepID=UPI0037FF582E